MCFAFVCSVSAPVSQDVCSGGKFVTCPAATSVSLPPLPTIGSMSYASSDTTCSKGPTSMLLYSRNACINGGTSYSCSCSGDSLSYSLYSSSAGACGQLSSSGGYATNQCAATRVYNCSLSVASFLAARAAATPTSSSSSSTGGAGSAVPTSTGPAAQDSCTGGSSDSGAGGASTGPQAQSTAALSDAASVSPAASLAILIITLRLLAAVLLQLDM
jgi:hypothetical protein